MWRGTGEFPGGGTCDDAPGSLRRCREGEDKGVERNGSRGGRGSPLTVTPPSRYGDMTWGLSEKSMSQRRELKDRREKKKKKRRHCVHYRRFTTLVSFSRLISSLLSSTLCSDGPRRSMILVDVFVLRSLCDPMISDSLSPLPPFLECIAP